VVLASVSEHKGSNGSSVRSLVLGEYRMRRGHWVGSVFCVAFTLLIVANEGELANPG